MSEYYTYIDDGHVHYEGYICDSEEDELDYCRCGNMENVE